MSDRGLCVAACRAQEEVKVTTPSPSPFRLTRGVAPIYPPIAQAARLSGKVIIEVTIGASGKVTDTRIVRSIPLLDQAALDAVRQWDFTAPPATAPSSGETTIAANFVFFQATPRAVMPPTDVPQEFAFDFSSRCAAGSFQISTVSDLLLWSDNATPATPIPLGLTSDDLAAVYRGLTAMDFFGDHGGLGVWPAQAAAPEANFEVAVLGTPPIVDVVSTHVADRVPGYSLVVRGRGLWIQAWPPLPGERSGGYANQIGAVKDLILKPSKRRKAGVRRHAGSTRAANSLVLRADAGAQRRARTVTCCERGKGPRAGDPSAERSDAARLESIALSDSVISLEKGLRVTPTREMSRSQTSVGDPRKGDLPHIGLVP